MGAIGHILTSQEILARLKLVDGSGSGLDADTVDALDSTALLGSIAGRSAKTANYTVVAGDRGYVIDCTANSFTLSLTAAATLGAGFEFTVVNTGSGIITVDPNSSETIRTPSGSGTTAVLPQGQAMTIICDGSGFTAIAVAVPPGAAGRLAKTATYTVVAADRGMVIDCTANSFTVNLTAAATLAAGFCVWIYNSGSGTVTLDPNSSETIRDPAGSATTKTLAQGQGYLLICDGSGFLAITTAASSGSSTTGTLGALDVSSPVSITTTASITSTGKNKLHVCTGTSANYTVTLSTSSGWSAGDVVAIKIDKTCTKLISIAHSSDIDGVNPRVMWAGEHCVLRWDGTKFHKIAGTTIPMCGKIFADDGTPQSLSDDTLTTLTLNYDIASFGLNALPDGILVKASNKITLPRPGLYRLTAEASLADGTTDLSYAILRVRVASGVSIGGDEVSAKDTGVAVRLTASGLYYSGAGGQDIIADIQQKSGGSRNIGVSILGFDNNAALIMQEIPDW